MNDMKLGMGLLRYTYGIKMNMVVLAFCVAGDLLCFALELMGVEVNYTGVGGYLLFAVGMVPIQLLFSLNVAGSVLSSPLRKKLQTSVLAVMSWWTMTAAYLLIVLQKLVIVLAHPERMGQICAQLASLAFLGAVITVFTGVLYKSTIAFFGMIFALQFLVHLYFFWNFHWDIFENNMTSLVWSVLLGFMMIMAGAAVEYGCLLLFYKKPVSKRTMGLQAMKDL